MCSYYDIGERRRRPGHTAMRYTEVAAIVGSHLVRARQAIVELDGQRLQLEPGQTVVSHGIDRDLSVSEVQAVV